MRRAGRRAAGTENGGDPETSPDSGAGANGAGLDTGGGDNDTDPTDLRSAGQRRVDALVEVCRLASACGQLPDNGGDRPQVVVTIDYDRLRDQVGAATFDDGAHLSAAAARRIACDAGIIPAVLGGASQTLDLGRQTRLVTGPLRRALVLRDKGCAFPGCDRPPRWTDAHHIRHWTRDNGPTELPNLVLLCGHHHRLIHHSDWQVRINPKDGLPEIHPTGIHRLGSNSQTQPIPPAGVGPDASTAPPNDPPPGRRAPAQQTGLPRRAYQLQRPEVGPASGFRVWRGGRAASTGTTVPFTGVLPPHVCGRQGR
jgi:hypothetical protein